MWVAGALHLRVTDPPKAASLWLSRSGMESTTVAGAGSALGWAFPGTAVIV